MRDAYAGALLWLFEVFVEPAIELRERRRAEKTAAHRARVMLQRVNEARASRGEPPLDALPAHPVEEH